MPVCHTNKKNSKKIYKLARWKRLRAAKLRVNPLCEHCIKPTVANQVDHITPIARGGSPWDWDNLQSLCASCHSKKTNAEDGGAFNPPKDRRVDPETGKPMDPGHWWQADARASKKSLKAEAQGPARVPKLRVS